MGLGFTLNWQHIPADNEFETWSSSVGVSQPVWVCCFLFTSPTTMIMTNTTIINHLSMQHRMPHHIFTSLIHYCKWHVVHWLLFANHSQPTVTNTEMGELINWTGGCTHHSTSKLKSHVVKSHCITKKNWRGVRLWDVLIQKMKTVIQSQHIQSNQSKKSTSQWNVRIWQNKANNVLHRPNPTDMLPKLGVGCGGLTLGALAFFQCWFICGQGPQQTMGTK